MHICESSLIYFASCKLPITTTCCEIGDINGLASIQVWYHFVEEACVCAVAAEQIFIKPSEHK